MSSGSLGGPADYGLGLHPSDEGVSAGMGLGSRHDPYRLDGELEYGESNRSRRVDACECTRSWMWGFRLCERGSRRLGVWSAFAAVSAKFTSCL